jgi:hypothetical protein
VGTRIGVANMELRLQFLGTDELGVFSAPFLPTELVAFADAGVAWSAGEDPVLTFERDTSARVPVFSAGVSARMAVLGVLPIELYLAHPFQRPHKDFVFGFQVAPGW